MTTLAQEFGFTADQAQAITAKAFDLLEAGDLDGAIVIFDGLLVLNPEDASIHAALGSVLHEQGKLAEAEAAYDTALQLDPNAPLARVNRGELRCKRGDRAGLDDLSVAAANPSAVQARARALVRRFTP